MKPEIAKVICTGHKGTDTGYKPCLKLSLEKFEKSGDTTSVKVDIVPVETKAACSVAQERCPAEAFYY